MTSTPRRNHFLMQRLPWIIAAVVALGLLAMLVRGRDRQVAAAPERPQLAPEGAVQAGRPAGKVRPAVYYPRGSTEPALARQSPGSRKQGQRKSPEQLAAERDKQIADLEAAFKNERPDPAGGGKLEDTLEKVVGGEIMKPTGIAPDELTIDCKQTTCRILADFNKPGDAQDWGMFYLSAASPNLSRGHMVVVPGGDGTATLRVYATRGR